ncbi:MAG: DUF6526 family protein, partial [Acidobacteriaceae bacterium]|nr:DUF6526 family protein [Acidobacteriaceae bacterium]
MAAEQNFKNHARFDPVVHFFVVPVLAVSLIAAIAATIHYWPEYAHEHLWLSVLLVALIASVVRTRLNDLKVQDRLIRLEERLRLTALLPAEEHARIYELSI